MTPRRTAQLPWMRAVAPLAAAAALACGVQEAAAENWPLYVTGTQRITHDSNLFRRETDADSDTASSTSLTLGLDKSYGRQNYRASVTGSMNRYRNNSQLNNNGFDASGGIDTTIGKDGYLAIGGSKSRALASFDNGRVRNTDKNIRDSSSLAVSGRYGMYGALSIGASASRFEQEYSLTSGAYPDTSSNSYGVDVRYTPRQLLSFGVGYRHSPGKTSYGLDNGDLDYTTKTNNLDLTTNWQVTGLSTLAARLSYTKQDREASAADSTLNSDGYKGWTGSLDWKYTPRGRITYKAGFNRDTTNNASSSDFYNFEGFQNNTPIFTPGTSDTGDSRVATSVNAGLDWEASAKIRLSLDGALTRLRTSQTTATTLPSGTSYKTREQTSTQKSLGVSVNYGALRWLDLNCGVSHIRRTEDLFNDGFKATVVSCSAAATLNAQN